MAQTTPPPIDPVPTPVPQRGDRATFSNRVDTFILWLVNAVTQFAAVATNVYNNAVDAFNSATAASTARTGAETARTDAQTARTGAETARTGAETARTGAETARDAAQNYAAALTATSTSSVLLGTGAKTFTTQAGKQFTVGARLYIVNPSDATQFISGPVTAYSGTTLTIEADVFGGSGTVSNWNISLSGARGVQGLTGGVTGGSLTGALWEKKGADLASAGTIDPWSGGGNFLPLIGVATITAIAPAPQAGAKVTLLATSAATITAGANLQIKGVPSGQPYTLSPGDELDVRAETTTTFRVTVRRGDGMPTAQSMGAFHNLRVYTGSGVFTPTKTGWHKITAIGGSGSGGAASAILGAPAAAGGAGAGGLCIGMRYLVEGQSYVVQVGAGGLAHQVPAGAGSVAANGNAGSASQFSGTGIVTMVANGGQGGQARVTTGTASGGAGGTASGGDINIAGGAGGSATSSANGASAAGGGGAVSLRGKPFNGGNASNSSSGGNLALAGGAGVGGHGGNATSTSGTSAFAAGGGVGGSANSVTNATSAQSDAGADWRGAAGGNGSLPGFQSNGVPAINELDRALAGGAWTTSGGSAGVGGGGAGNPTTGQTMGSSMFGGAAGTGNINATTSQSGAQGGQYGGGNGGVAVISGNAGSTYGVNAPAGTAGGVWIEF